MNPKHVVSLFEQTVADWSEDRVPRLGAALAYYSVFSIAPLLLLVIAVASHVFGEKAAEGAIVSELGETLGTPVAQAIQDMLENARNSGATSLATVLGIIILFLGASGVFGELQDALNTIWKVKPKPGRAWLTVLRERFFSFTMVVGTGFLLLVSLVISAVLAAVGQYLSNAALPGGVALWQGVTWLVSLAFIALVFALIFRVVPDVKLHWSDVWLGAVLTALLFALGKFALSLYLGWSTTTSAYGAAGSLVVLLLWVYYSAQILLFGAEFTRVYTLRYGSHFVVAADNAVPVTAEERARQGMPWTEDVAAATRAQEAAHADRSGAPAGS
jgi:membrane protein